MANTQKTTPHGRPPGVKGEDKRERILGNALTLFAEQGIAGTTFAQIAKVSDVTPAMLHYYFGNRDGLLDALVSERLVPVLEYLWSVASDDALTDLHRFVTDFVDRLLEIVTLMPQLPLLWSREVMHAGGLLRERAMATAPFETVGKVNRAFTDAQRSGKLNENVAPAMILSSLLTLVMIPLATRDLLGKIPDFPVLDKALLRKHALALVLDGLCLKPLEKGEQ